MLRVPGTAGAFDPRTEDGRAWLHEAYALPDPEYVRLNMITSLTGSAAGSDGTSETLTSADDRAILGVIRAQADVVLVGAQTVRAEGYVVPRTARLAIVTATGVLDGHRLTLDAPADRARVLILSPADRADAVRDAVAPLGLRVVPVPVPVPNPGASEGRPTPAALVQALRAEGLPRIVCEGGPGLASQFVAAGAIDEYCVTVAPVIGPIARPFVDVDAAHVPRTRVVGQLTDDAGFTYLRLRPAR
ncbi:dihydrofolate reductase family protein [Microbacterium sp. X-17]|uniref:dihydrofolate reductase family protein n=1 Tax=Microbacterium sp. X-17 TaxID=3144404 RepID=UPI0031F48755